MCSKLEKTSLFLTILPLKITFCPGEKNPHPPIFQSYQEQDLLRLVLPGIPIFSSLPIRSLREGRRGCASWHWRGAERRWYPLRASIPSCPSPCRGMGHAPKDFMLLVLGKAHPRVARGKLLLAKGYPVSVGLFKVDVFLDVQGEE